MASAPEIAVAVIGVDSVAEICDGAQIIQKEDISLNDLTIQAESTNKETMTAKAGSAGGFSATPVVALTISAVTNEALLGKTGGAEVLKALNGSVEAKSYIDRQLAANASAAGGSVGLGGSFAITVLNDTTRAESRKSFKGSSLKVSTQGRSNLRSTSRAGANGAAPSDAPVAGSGSTGSGGTSSGGSGSGSGSGSSGSGSGSGSGSPPASGTSDAQANRAIGGASNLANTGNRGLSGNQVQTMSRNRSNATTDDGKNIQIAAGFNLNIQKNINESVIDGEVTVELDDRLEITAYNDTDASVIANASAVSSQVGVGVAVAINIVDFVNRAVIGQASITADSIHLVAEMYDDGSYNQMLAAEAAQEDKSINILDFLVKKAISESIEDAVANLDPTSRSIVSGLGDFVSDLTGALVGQFTQTLLTNAGLEGFLSTDIETKLLAFDDNFEQKLSKAGIDILKNVFLTYMLNRLTSLASTTLGQVTDKITGTVTIPGAAKPSTSQVSGSTAAGTGSAAATPSGSLQSLLEKLSQTQKQTLGDLKPLFLQSLETFASDLFRDFINVDQLKTFVLTGLGQNIKAALLNALTSSGKAATDSLLGALSEWADAKVVPQRLYPTHTFTTQAISGAGATSIGVAGSLALAFVDGTTEARIADAADTASGAKYPIVARRNW